MYVEGAHDVQAVGDASIVFSDAWLALLTLPHVRQLSFRHIPDVTSRSIITSQNVPRILCTKSLFQNTHQVHEVGHHRKRV